MAAHEYVVDAVDVAILTELQHDARLSMAEVGRRVGLAGSTTSERVARLVEEGVIRGWRLDVDPAALGLPITAVVRIRPGPGQLTPLTRQIQAMERITEAHRVTGEDCLAMTVHAATVEDLADTLDRLQLYGTSTTSVVVSTPVPSRPLPAGALHRTLQRDT